MRGGVKRGRLRSRVGRRQLRSSMGAGGKAYRGVLAAVWRGGRRSGRSMHPRQARPAGNEKYFRLPLLTASFATAACHRPPPSTTLSRRPPTWPTANDTARCGWMTAPPSWPWRWQRRGRTLPPLPVCGVKGQRGQPTADRPLPIPLIVISGARRTKFAGARRGPVEIRNKPI